MHNKEILEFKANLDEDQKADVDDKVFSCLLKSLEVVTDPKLNYSQV